MFTICNLQFNFKKKFNQDADGDKWQCVCVQVYMLGNMVFFLRKKNNLTSRTFVYIILLNIVQI